jgi:hypothetical protein
VQGEGIDGQLTARALSAHPMSLRQVPFPRYTLNGGALQEVFGVRDDPPLKRLAQYPNGEMSSDRLNVPHRVQQLQQALGQG